MGIGVINSQDGAIYDTSSNQLNGPGSAFYDADTRDIKQPFDDAFTEFIFPRSGMGAVPYLPQEWFSAANNNSSLRLFRQLWFANKDAMPSPNQEFNYPHNYFHLMGASSSIDARFRTKRPGGGLRTPHKPPFLLQPPLPLRTRPKPATKASLKSSPHYSTLRLAFVVARCHRSLRL